MPESHTDIPHDERLVVKRLILLREYDIIHSDEGQGIYGTTAYLVLRRRVVSVLLYVLRLALLCRAHRFICDGISEYRFGSVYHNSTPFLVLYVSECSFPLSIYFILIR